MASKKAIENMALKTGSIVVFKGPWSKEPADVRWVRRKTMYSRLRNRRKRLEKGEGIMCTTNNK